ncbi:MAG: glutamate-1-semialdehyde 2,1-aminomutase [Planctomycetota bacterium]
MTLAETSIPSQTQATGQAVDLPRSVAHQRRAHALIPGAAHTYAKGDDQYAHGLAPVITRGKGCRVWDLDGREYIEYGAGVRAVTLGHGYLRVCEAAQRELWNGVNFARPAAIELEAAEVFLDMIPSAEMVKFAKNGSDATTAAVKLARAVTGRSKIAVCEDQPFFSIDDWFIGMTATDAGIPGNIKHDSVGFRFNDLADLHRLFAEHGGDLACIIMEAERDEVPAPGYLQAVRDACDKNCTLLIIDETISGFRLHPGGAAALHEVDPDLITFGKGMANGFSVSALAGKEIFMQRGGLDTHLEKVFLLSTTHGGETHCLAASIETMKEVRDAGVCDRLADAGRLLAKLINDAAKAEGVHEHFHVIGHPSNLIYVTKDASGQRSQPFRTLFLQESVRRGLIAPNLVVNFSHTDDDLRQTADRIAEILPLYKRALEDGVDTVLEGRPVKPVFRKYN